MAYFYANDSFLRGIRKTNMHQTLQAPNTILMVRPGAFYPNPDTQSCNGFQSKALSTSHHQSLLLKAQTEFDQVEAALLEVGIEVNVFQDSPNPAKPDAIFPNNWFSTHANGAVVIYPMFSPARRHEKAAYSEIEGFLSKAYDIDKCIDLSHYEQQSRFLEGTGVLCIDHINKTAYVGLSNRADAGLVEEVCGILKLTPIIFSTELPDQKAVYHTNVMLSIGTEFALLGADMMASVEQRNHIIHSLEASGKTVILLSNQQVAEFAANAIELTGTEGRYLAISQRGRDSLTSKQVSAIEAHASLLSVPLSTVELSGGSMRCMIAGIHLPERQNRP